MSKERQAVWMNETMLKNLKQVTPMDVSATVAVRHCIACTKQLNEVEHLLRDESIDRDDLLQQIVDIVL